MNLSQIVVPILCLQLLRRGPERERERERREREMYVCVCVCVCVYVCVYIPLMVMTQQLVLKHVYAIARV